MYHSDLDDFWYTTRIPTSLFALLLVPFSWPHRVVSHLKRIAVNESVNSEPAPPFPQLLPLCNKSVPFDDARRKRGCRLVVEGEPRRPACFRPTLALASPGTLFRPSAGSTCTHKCASFPRNCLRCLSVTPVKRRTRRRATPCWALRSQSIEKPALQLFRFIYLHARSYAVLLSEGSAMHA